MNFEEELLIITAQKLGINKSGNRTGNGLLTEVEQIQDYIDADKMHHKETDIRLNMIEKDIKEIKDDIKIIKNELKDNINMRSFANAKSLFSGIAQVITSFGVISGALYFILKFFMER